MHHRTITKVPRTTSSHCTRRPPKQWVSRFVLSAGALLVMASTVWAQDAPPPPVAGDSASHATTVALTGGLILAGAAGAQLVKSPERWAQTWPGFGYRIADQTGFYVVQTSTARAIGRALHYRPDVTLCPRDALVTCAFTATFSALDAQGRRRFNVPLVTSIVVGTGTSLLWRPERHDNRQAWAFVGTRLGIVLGGYVAERVAMDWWAQLSQRGRVNAAMPAK